VGGFGIGVYFKSIPLQKYSTLGHFTHHKPVMKATFVPSRYKCVFLFCSFQSVIILTKWFCLLNCNRTTYAWSPDNAVGITTCYWLDVEGSNFDSLQGGKIYLYDAVQTGPGAHPASHPMGTGGSFPRGEADHSSSTRTKIRNAWIYISWRSV
jgi:hypothetical protein